ncbi:MAG TPA: ABC transporter permease [Acetobacteraceae bacterium]|jgi:peptide/nickel transport system permease protein|nr:ABC transporter permease [Acetobacteraceae bacterium]
MFAFIFSRILQSIPVLLVVGFISFAMFAFVGDPVTTMLGQDFTEAQRLALVHQLGLDKPFFLQYLDYLWAALHGNFGISYRMARPVSVLIAERLPATVELAVTSAVLAVVVGVPMGVYTGIRRNSFVSRIFMIFSLLGVSLPTFLIGILLILVFSVLLGWLPSYGRGDVVQFAHWSTGFLTLSGLKALILPAITLALFQMTLIMRLVRSEMLEVLRSDYVKFARARGLSERAINFGHALKNTLVPVITIIGLQLGGLVAFSIVTETVFQWPGMGLLLVQSITAADMPIMAAYLQLIAVVFVVINLLVDLLYYAVDPRLRVGRGAH